MWDLYLSDAAKNIKSSAIRDLLKVTEQPEFISFAGGLPAAESFPMEHLTAAAERAMVENPLGSLQYGPTEGYTPLRAFLSEHMRRLNLHVPPEQVLISSGSQQALDLLGKLFIDEGALIAVENPTYLGALQAWRPYAPRFAALPMDDEGLRVDALEQLLKGGERPRFLYVVSCFQNPTGVTISPARKEALLRVAHEYHLPIIEDDPYGELYYNGERPPLLAAMDAQMHGELRHVIYLSTFSKLLAPGLRVGWVIAPEPLLAKIVAAKQGMDLHTGSLSQVMAYEACREGFLTGHVPTIRALYQQRRDAMLAALRDHMPDGVRWTTPDGGMFLWLTLPEHIDTKDLLAAAIEQYVVFVPGESFHANGGGSNTMRLNYSYSPAERIEEGVRRLAAAIRQQL